MSGLRDGDDGKDTRLSDHVHDVTDFLESRDLGSVVLVGHCYSGIVVGLVAAAAPQRVAHTVFVEAFLPVEGRSLLEVSGLDVDEEMSLIDSNGGLWPAPTASELASQPQLSAQQVSRLLSKQKDHPGKTVTDAASLQSPLEGIVATFISDDDWLSSSRQSDLLAALRAKGMWKFRAIDGGHWPMLTRSPQLAEMLQRARV